MSAVSAVAVFCSTIALAACGAAGPGDPPGDPPPKQRVPEPGDPPASVPTPADREMPTANGAAHGSPTDEENRKPQPTGVVHVVQVSDTGFAPRVMTIALGDTVQFDFVSDRQSVTSGFECLADGMFDSGVRERTQSYRVTFLRTGAFPFYSLGDCGELTGALLVK
jgi:plastocyanin